MEKKRALCVHMGHKAKETLIIIHHTPQTGNVLLKNKTVCWSVIGNLFCQRAWKIECAQTMEPVGGRWCWVGLLQRNHVYILLLAYILILIFIVFFWGQEPGNLFSWLFSEFFFFCISLQFGFKTIKREDFMGFFSVCIYLMRTVWWG